MESLKPTKSWRDNYIVDESLNTFKLSYSEANNSCLIFLFVNISGPPDVIKEKQTRLFIESIVLNENELLSESVILTIGPREPLLNFSTTEEGLLKLRMSATSEVNVTIEMKQFEEQMCVEYGK